jgi:hypothetical protein
MNRVIRDVLVLVVLVALGGATLACTSLTQAPARTATLAGSTPPRPTLTATARSPPP